MKQWDVNWGVYRRAVIFAASVNAFKAGIQSLLQYARQICDAGEPAYGESLVTEILIDLQSALTWWVLDQNVSSEEKAIACDELRAFLKERCANSELERAEKEAESIRKSQFARITRATLDGKLFTYWGSDLCTGVDFSLRRGASFTTSNPSKINLFRQAEPLQYQAYVKEIMEQHLGLTKEQLLSYVSMKVVAQVARQTRPIFEATNGRFGVSFTQVSPTSWNNAQEMIDEAKLWFSEFQRELGTDRPNVVFKLPATPAAKEAAKELLKDSRIRVTFTSNFAVGQHKPFLEIINDREPNCFLVLVDCHLRKFARPEFEAMGVTNPDYYCERLVHAVYQKCYQQLLDNKSHAMINGAGMREDVGIRLCLTDLPELPCTLTVTPSLAATFDSEERSLDIIWNKPISEEDMAVLNRSQIFRKAYYEDEFPWNDIESFQPYTFMMDGFMDARKACLDTMPDYE